MPMRTALRLCPHAVRVSPRFGRYSELSGRIIAIFRSVTPLVEPLSLDEAFLDVTAQTGEFEEAEGLARRLKERVWDATGLVVSIGLGTGKAVAKIASDAGKPDGFVVVPPGTEQAFLAPLPARALWGIGPRAEERLQAAGISTIGQLAEAGPATLEAVLGSWGAVISRLARGDDDRQVQPERKRKSVGAETTFAHDLPDGPVLRAELTRMVDRVARHLEDSDLRAGTVGLKLRYADFRTITRQASWPAGTQDRDQVLAAAERLLDGVARPGDHFRLIGVHCSRLEPAGQGQLTLWSAG
jgi:DNA polymerase-4